MGRSGLFRRNLGRHGDDRWFGGAHLRRRYSRTCASPGNASPLKVGDLSFNTGFDPQLRSRRAVAASDEVISAAGLTINGSTTLNINTLSGFGAGTYTLLDYATMLTGNFSDLTLATMPPSGFSWQLVNNTGNTSIDLEVMSTAVPGDFNHDGTVDAADYVVWRKTDSTQAGYVAWRSNFGQPPGSGAGAIANAAVPEPATLVLLMFAAAGWCLRRGRAA